MATNCNFGYLWNSRHNAVLRATLLDELNKPYVTTARAKGLPEWKVILKYPVRIAINPLVSTIGYFLVDRWRNCRIKGIKHSNDRTSFVKCANGTRYVFSWWNCNDLKLFDGSRNPYI